MMKYRIKLWELLAERNLKITQVCKDTGLSRPTLNAIKYGRSKGIQLETIDVLCNYFKITPGELFWEKNTSYKVGKGVNAKTVW